jgi:hypothetical protein
MENTTNFNPQSQSFQHSVAVNIQTACLASDQHEHALKFFLFPTSVELRSVIDNSMWNYHYVDIPLRGSINEQC